MKFATFLTLAIVHLACIVMAHRGGNHRGFGGKPRGLFPFGNKLNCTLSNADTTTETGPFNATMCTTPVRAEDTTCAATSTRFVFKYGRCWPFCGCPTTEPGNNFPNKKACVSTCKVRKGGKGRGKKGKKGPKFFPFGNKLNCTLPGIVPTNERGPFNATMCTTPVRAEDTTCAATSVRFVFRNGKCKPFCGCATTEPGNNFPHLKACARACIFRRGGLLGRRGKQ